MLALGLLGPVTRALAGTYRCTAVNGQGQAVKDVTLTVECEWGEVGMRISFGKLAYREGKRPIQLQQGLGEHWREVVGCL